MEIRFATSSPYKLTEIRDVLERPVTQLKIELPEIQAIGVQEVIEHKARAAYLQVGHPVLVEDTGLSFHAWHGLPGALVRWFLETVGNDGVCRMLTEYENRAATAETCLGYFDGEQCFSFSGTLDGYIVECPQGDQGFGWDPIFVPNGWEKTFAEMTRAEKGAVSMRSRAALQLRSFLEECTL